MAIVRNERDEHFLRIAGQFLENDGANFLNDVGVFLADDGARLIQGSGELIEDSSGTFRIVGRLLGEHINNDVGRFIEEDFADVTQDVGRFLSSDGSEITQDFGIFMRDEGTNYTRIAGDIIQTEANSILLAIDLFPAVHVLRAPGKISLRSLPVLTTTACGIADNVDINQSIRIVGSILGDVIEGNPLWYQVTTDNGEIGFVHSSELDIDPMTIATSTNRLPTIHELDTDQSLGFGKAVEDDFMTNVRECPSTSACPVIDQLFPGEPFIVFEVSTGSEFQGSRTWYMISFRETVGFVHEARTEPVEF